MINPKEIRLQQEVVKQRLIVKRLYKESRGLITQNLALKAALVKVKSEQELERSETGHSGYSETWLISSNALLALEGVGDE